uniref:Uncharacterized protein n=1 Tax=viral metagenome TaxID=1070528 RepID=A0A6M3JI74_9ZZZZ
MKIEGGTTNYCGLPFWGLFNKVIWGNNMKDKVEWDEMRDTLIEEYCDDRCKEYITDYHCPNHSCPVWKTLEFCVTEDLKQN